jgi:NADPH2:quinone reductase
MTTAHTNASTTRAAWYEQNGEARDVMKVGELPLQALGAGEVCVHLLTSGVNPSDVKSRRAKPLTSPWVVPHSDGAGIIEAVGEGVSEKRIGERVWIWNAQWQRPHGSASEAIVLPESQAVKLPDNTDFAAGACMGIPGLTAVQAVHLAGNEQLRGKKVLVTGASSAVGHYITQLVTQYGGQVIGTVGSEVKAAHAKAAGAVETILYKTEPVLERLKALTGGQGVDAIIDMDFATASQWVTAGGLKPHGQLIGYGSNVVGDIPLTFRPLLFNSIGLKFFLVYDLLPADRAWCVNRVNELLAAGKLQHTIGARFSLDQIVQAHEAVEAGQLGNVVIDL